MVAAADAGAEVALVGGVIPGGAQAAHLLLAVPHQLRLGDTDARVLNDLLLRGVAHRADPAGDLQLLLVLDHHDVVDHLFPVDNGGSGELRLEVVVEAVGDGGQLHGDGGLLAVVLVEDLVGDLEEGDRLHARIGRFPEADVLDVALIFEPAPLRDRHQQGGLLVGPDEDAVPEVEVVVEVARHIGVLLLVGEDHHVDAAFAQLRAHLLGIPPEERVIHHAVTAPFPIRFSRTA